MSIVTNTVIKINKLRERCLFSQYLVSDDVESVINDANMGVIVDWSDHC